MVESGAKTQVSLGLYIVAIALFAISAWPLPRTPVDTPVIDTAAEKPQAKIKIRAWLLLWVGVMVSVVISGLALNQVNQDLNSLAGVYLWLASLIALGLTGIPHWLNVWLGSEVGRTCFPISIHGGAGRCWP